MRLDALLDRTLLFAWDRSGYERHARRFDDVVERSLEGTHVVITGGTCGVGLAAARGLAARGAHVHLWGRDATRGAAAERRIRDEGGRATFRAVDLGDLADVAAAAATLRVRRLAGVVCAGGSLPRRRELTPQGHERAWATHVLGHVVLLRRLRREGLLGRESRVVWVGSSALYLARLDQVDLRRDDGYPRGRVHAVARRAQLVIASHLAERWRDVPMAVMHPGWVDTVGVRKGPQRVRRLLRGFLRDHDQGADTAVWLLARRVPGRTGALWCDRAVQPPHAFKATRERPEERAALLRRVLADTERYLPPGLPDGTSPRR